MIGGGCGADPPIAHGSISRGSGYDRAPMTETMTALEVARGWRVQRFGRRGQHEVPDPIVEPLWDGPRVLVAIEGEVAATFHEGTRLAGPAEILEQLAQVATAAALVAEGHLTPQALGTGEGAMLEPPEQTPSWRARMFGTMGTGRRDALLAEKEEANRIARRDERVVAGDAGPLAFVATDLLWLEGEELIDVPLLERKRLLESALGESALVRRSAYVRPSATGSIIGWKALGFTTLAYKAANSRYLPGEPNDGWAAVPVPGSGTPVSSGQR